MRALITGLLVAFVALVTRGHAQQPAPRFWVAPFGTASLNNSPTLSHARLGVRVALPFLDRLTFYPAVEIEPEIAFSQAFLGLRLQPLGSRGPASLWYVGGGLAAARYHTRTDLFTGVQRPSGSFKPFIELHLFGNLGSPSVDVQMGLAIPVS